MNIRRKGKEEEEGRWGRTEDGKGKEDEDRSEEEKERKSIVYNNIRV